MGGEWHELNMGKTDRRTVMMGSGCGLFATLCVDTAAKLRVAHLKMVQVVIARMSSYSASVKNSNASETLRRRAASLLV
jgi:hypothetical protein